MHRDLLIRIILIFGLLLMLAGTLDPLEGSVVIVAGLVFVVVGAYLDHGNYRVLLYTSLALAAAGTAAIFILSAYGGVGGATGRDVVGDDLCSVSRGVAAGPGVRREDADSRIPPSGGPALRCLTVDVGITLGIPAICAALRPSPFAVRIAVPERTLEES